MRLSSKERKTIRDTVFTFDPKAKIYLYGSRADKQRKGGDIDLLILSKKINFSAKITLLVSLKEKIGNQKIDMTIKDPKSYKDDPFVLQILNHAIKL